MLTWFDQNDVSFVNLLPHFYEPGNVLFSQKNRDEISKIDDLLLMFDSKQIREGGFFVMIGKKKSYRQTEKR